MYTFALVKCFASIENVILICIILIFMTRYVYNSRVTNGCRLYIHIFITDIQKLPTSFSVVSLLRNWNKVSYSNKVNTARKAILTELR